MADENPHERSASSESVLADIYQEIRRKVPDDVYLIGIEKFLKRRYGHQVNVKEISSARGNLKKELDKKSMSWKIFMRALDILSVAKVDIHIRLTGQNGTQVEVSRTLRLSRIVGEEHNPATKPDPSKEIQVRDDEN